MRGRDMETETIPADTLDNILADTDAELAEAQPDPAPAPAEPAAEPAPKGKTEEAKADADTRVKQLEAEVAKLSKSYEHVRTYADRNSGDNAKLREQLAAASAKLEVLSTAQPGVSQEEMARQQQQYEAEWLKRFEAGDERAFIDFTRGSIGEYDKAARAREAALAKKLEALESTITEKLAETRRVADPERRQLQPQIKHLVDSYGMSEDAAFKMAKDLASKKTAQPARPATPGRAAVGTESPAGPTPKPPVAPLPGMEELWSELNLPDADKADLRKEPANV